MTKYGICRVGAMTPCEESYLQICIFKSDNTKRNLAQQSSFLFQSTFVELWKALNWLGQFLRLRERDAEALQLSGACCSNLNRPKEALEFYRKSLEARPKQPQVAMKMAELLIRQPETKNLNSAQIWLSKAEALNRGSPELFDLKMDYMRSKGVKPIEIVNFIQNQIKQNTRQLNLYTALIEQVSLLFFDFRSFSDDCWRTASWQKGCRVGEGHLTPFLSIQIQSVAGSCNRKQSPRSKRAIGETNYTLPSETWFLLTDKQWFAKTWRNVWWVQWSAIEKWSQLATAFSSFKFARGRR